MTNSRTSQTRRRAADLSRGIAAAAVLMLFVCGVPLALVALAPTYVPSVERRRLASAGDLLLSPDDGTLLFATIGLTAWIAWFVFTVSVAVEIVASVRRRPSPRLPLTGGLQRHASRLVATAAVLFAVGSGTAVHAAPASVDMSTSAPLAPAPTSTPPAVSSPDATPPASQAPPQAARPVVTVARGDTLWGIAERHLGAGTRYVEIRDLNLGRVQADGRTMVDADWILPGWTLEMPFDAVGLDLATGAPPPPVPTQVSSVVVQPGDTLWEIAQAHLGDGQRFTEIAAANQGVLQSDGASLDDPDDIRVGWILSMPPSSTASEALFQTSPPAPLDPESADVEAGSSTDDGRVQPVPGSAIEPPFVPLPERASNSVASPTPDVASPGEAEPGDTDDPESQGRSIWFLGLTALGAAGVLGELARRRHLQRRARRAGEMIPMPLPGSPAARGERELHAAATPVSITQIRTALLSMATACFEAGLDLPRVGIVLLDERELTLRLTDDFPVAAEPFCATDPRTWTATTEAISDLTPSDDADSCTPYPLLVTLGHTDTHTVVANLEAAGTLAVTGDGDASVDIVRAIALEAATSELSQDIAVIVDSAWSDLAPAFEHHRLRRSGDGSHRARAIEEVRRHLANHGLDDVLQARSDRQAPDGLLPVLYVEHTGDSPWSEPWSAVATVTTAPSDHGWILDAHQDGHAHLMPWSMDLRAQRLRPPDAETLGSLLRLAIPPAPQAVHEENAPEDALALVRHVVTTAYRGGPSDTTIRVLGHIEVNGPTTTADLSPRMTELLVYLVLHGPATGAELDDVLWNGARISPGTRNALVYRTRQKVGEAVLPRVGPDGLYRLGTSVTSDWAAFEAMAHAASLEVDDARASALATALDFVRGRPFQGVGGESYTWADNDMERMASVIADVALTLAQHLAASGRPREAIDAALKGLLVEPYSELLQSVVIDASEKVGGREQAEARSREFATKLARLDAEAT